MDLSLESPSVSGRPTRLVSGEPAEQERSDDESAAYPHENRLTRSRLQLLSCACLSSLQDATPLQHQPQQCRRGSERQSDREEDLRAHRTHERRLPSELCR